MHYSENNACMYGVYMYVRDITKINFSPKKIAIDCIKLY